MTGTDDAGAVESDEESTKNRDRKMDSFRTDLDGQIRTCADGARGGNACHFERPETKKIPCLPRGNTGIDIGTPERSRTPNLQIRSLALYPIELPVHALSFAI